jgi:hypothetical protein
MTKRTDDPIVSRRRLTAREAVLLPGDPPLRDVIAALALKGLDVLELSVAGGRRSPPTMTLRARRICGVRQKSAVVLSKSAGQAAFGRFERRVSHILQIFCSLAQTGCRPVIGPV